MPRQESIDQYREPSKEACYAIHGHHQRDERFRSGGHAE